MNAQKTLTSIGFVGIWLASQAVCAQSITDGLVRHYRFDEASGAVAAIDSTGVSDLTQSAEAFAFPIPSSGQVGQIGGAWDFERDNGELLDEGDAIFGGTLNISVSAWLKPESFNPVGSANYTIFSEDSGSVANKDGWLQVSDAGAISWQIEGVGLLTSPAAVVPNGGWSHVAAVRDAGLSSLYVNGAEVATLAVPATITSDSVNDLMLGAIEDSDASDSWDGLLDDVGFWERALLQEEVVAIYETGLVGGDLTQAAAPGPPELDLRLGLVFNDPSDDQSGGFFHLTAKTSDGGGIAGLAVRLDGVDSNVPATPTLVSPETFGWFESIATSNGPVPPILDLGDGVTELLLGQDVSEPPAGLVYEIGNGAGTPGTQGADPFGEGFDDAALLATGTFSPGTIPTFDADLAAAASVFLAAGAVAVEEPTINLLTTDNLGSLAGDYDNDGVVDQDDYDVWAASFGSVFALSADGNRDGVVDAADYTVWRDNVPAAASAAVPEPSSLVTILACLFLAVAAGRIRGGRPTGVFPVSSRRMAPVAVGFAWLGMVGAAPAQVAGLSNDLVRYYPLDEAIGSEEAIDQVTPGVNNLTVNSSSRRSLPTAGAAGQIGGAWDFEATPTTTVGDYNATGGVVNGFDFITWQLNAGTTNFLPSDSTPNVVDSTDLDVWQDNYGQSLDDFPLLDLSGNPLGQFLDEGNEVWGGVSSANGVFFSIWVNPESLNGGTGPESRNTIISEDSPSQDFFVRSFEGGRVEVDFEGVGNVATAGVVLQPGTWTHLAGGILVDDGFAFGNTLQLFVDGQLAAFNDFATTNNPDVLNDLVLGMQDDVSDDIDSEIDPTNPLIGNFARTSWDGTMDDAAFWNRTLTTAEVQDIFARGSLGLGLLTPAPGASFAVPEPAAITAVAFGVLLGSRRDPRRRLRSRDAV